MIAKRAALLTLALAACGDGPPVWAPTPVAAGPESGGCVKARAMRTRAPQLLEEGKLDRAIRVLQRAEDLCPAEAPATWGLRVTALAAVGRAAEALQLAARIERSDRASDADRKAAQEARAAADEHARAVAAAGSRHDDPELYDPATKRREAAADLHRRGAAARRAGDAAGAKKLFLEAWRTWHPNPSALVEAGLAAQALGERAEAQRLWDRAAYDDSASAIRPEIPAGGPRILTGAAATWGARIAIAGDEEIAVFDGDLAPALRLRPGEAVSAVAFAGDAVLAAGLGGGRVLLYDAALGTTRGELRGHNGAVRVIAASPEGKTLATAAEDTALRLWDAVTGAAGRIFGTTRAPVAIAWSGDGARVAWADDAGAMSIAEVANGAVKSMPRARGGAVRAISFDGPSLFVVTANERLRYDLDKPRNPPRSAGRGRADLASFGAGGSVVAVEAGGAISAIDLASGNVLATAPSAEHGGLAGFTLAPGARSLAAVYRDRTVAVLPARDRADRREIGPASPLAAFAVAPTGKLFAGAADDGRTLLWSADPGRLAAFATRGASALAFSPDTRALAIGADRRIEVRDLASDAPGRALEVGGHVQFLAFSADGLRLAAATDAPAVELFPAGAAKAAQDLRLERGPVRALSFAPDGRALLLAPREAVVRWDPDAHRSARLLPYGPEPRDVSFTPDGDGMIVVDKRGELLFGKPVEASPGPSQRVAVTAQALAIAVAQNGMLAIAEGDRAISIRAPNGKLVIRFRAPDAAVRSLAFLPQGLVAASFADGLIRLFRAPVEGPVAVLRPAPGLRPGALAGIVESPSGHLEILGPDAAAARAVLRCRLGPALYPFDVCGEQYTMQNLLPLILSGQDPAEADP